MCVCVCGGGGCRKNEVLARNSGERPEKVGERPEKQGGRPEKMGRGQKKWGSHKSEGEDLK